MIYVKRTTIFALFGSLALGLGISCEQAPKVLPTKELAPDEKVLLDSSDRTEILSAFRSLTKGKKLVNRPARAIKGVRWSDVPKAVAAACGENGVEMAVVETITQDWGYTFIIKTVEDKPAQLIVRRLDNDQVYQASATVGRFHDDQKRADKLLAVFEQKMKAFGRKRGFEDE